MSELPVVNYQRMERLRPQKPTINFDLNMVCIIFIIICVLGLYNRYVTITQYRQQFYTSRIDERLNTDPSSSIF